MDTLETTEPAGSDDVTSSPDTSFSGETQTVEPEMTVDGGNEGEAGATETLLAGKYKSPEELEKAYKELEGKLGTLGQKASVADIIQERYGVTPDELREAIESQERARMEQQYRENPGAFAVQKVQELEQKLALQEEEKRLDSFLAQNQEYAPFRDLILKLALNLERNKGYEEIAKEYFGQARAQGQTDAYKKIEVKKNTQATGVSSVPKKALSQEDLKNLSVAELEAILPHADISHRLY